MAIDAAVVVAVVVGVVVGVVVVVALLVVVGDADVVVDGGRLEVEEVLALVPV
jgi:hypothetical protein